MDGPLPQPGEAGGKLAANIMHFARVLRATGMPVGPGKVVDAVRAVEVVGVANRRDFYWTLHAVFVNRRDQREIFDQAFHIFWRNPKLLERLMSLVLPTLEVAGRPDEAAAISRRLAEALQQRGAGAERDSEEQPTLDATMTWSDREVLRTMDFEQMSADEIARAKRIIAGMRLPIMAVPTRRFAPDARGARVDMRATLRAALRSGGATIPLQHKRRRRRHPPLVVLTDISGSMSRNSRMFLHFMHAITNDRDRVHTLVFGTRLTNITRYLRARDVDVALDRVAEAVEDWSGGTRIGHCLGTFNKFWSRRLLAQGAVVLLISDGLDRDAGAGLAREIERLQKSCRRLIWLNPLLRYAGYEAKSLGAKALLPHVDDFHAVHNLESLAQLAEALSSDQRRAVTPSMRAA